MIELKLSHSVHGESSQLVVNHFIGNLNLTYFAGVF